MPFFLFFIQKTSEESPNVQLNVPRIYNCACVFLEAVKSVVEHGVIALLQDLGDGDVAGKVLTLEVLLSVVEAVLVLLLVGVGTDPDKDLVANIEDEDVVRVEEALGDLGAGSFLGEDERTAGIGETIFVFLVVGLWRSDDVIICEHKEHNYSFGASCGLIFSFSLLKRYAMVKE